MENWEQLIVGIAVGFCAAYLLQMLRRWRDREEERQVRRVVSGYFKTLDVRATVACVQSPRGFFTLIESDSSRKSRFSPIREVAIIEHVEKVTGKTLRGVHWRFRPTKAMAQAAAVHGGEEEVPNYPDQLLPSDRKAGNYDVNEISWDKYESVLRTGADAQIEAHA